MTASPTGYKRGELILEWPDELRLRLWDSGSVPSRVWCCISSLRKAAIGGHVFMIYGAKE